MISWLHTTLIAAFAALILVLVLVLIFQRFLLPKPRTIIPLQHHDQVRPHSNLYRESSTNTNGFVSTEPFFSWADHPTLVADAVENGWPAFFVSSTSVESDDRGNETNVEIGWEGSQVSMQRIRLNSGLKKSIITSHEDSSMAVLSGIRMGLPLPGPRFGNSSFPQEAYFETTILSCNEDVKEDTLMTGEGFGGESPESLRKIEQARHGREREGENETIMVSVGLTGGGDLPLKSPGSFPGSIGFSSGGSVYLNGRKLVSESEKDEWGRAGNVIGCGYNPGGKNVYFTVNSQLVDVIHCSTEEFGHPLYPTIAASTDITVLMNLGQIPFKFEPANLQRTPNPCSIRPHENSPAIGFEDSRELFSMGRIDPKWNAPRSSSTIRVNSIRALEFDQESESDLFEIYLRS